MADDPDDKSGTPVDDAEALVVTVATSALGFPVPPTIAKNILRSLAGLVSDSADVARAWLQGRAQRIRDKTERESRLLRASTRAEVIPSDAEASGKATVITAAARAAAKKFGQDEALATRALGFFADRIVRQQDAREAITDEALAHLSQDPPTADADREIDADWLDMFARHAETRTNQEMRTYFARVLAAEIRKPGSFLPETLEVLAKLSPQVALMFQRLCGLVTKVDGYDPAVLLEPLPIGHGNELAEFGIPIEHIWRMGDAGLLRVNFQNLTIMAPSALYSAVVGGRHLSFRPLRVAPGAPDSPEVRQARAEMESGRSMRSLRLTAAGCELWAIVHATPNAAYMAKFLEWTHNGLLLWPASDPLA